MVATNESALGSPPSCVDDDFDSPSSLPSLCHSIMTGTRSSDDMPLAMTARRSGRVRTAVKKFQEEEVEEKEPPPRKKPTPKKRKPQKNVWDAEDFVTDPKSPLATADIRALLSNPLAWESLDREDQAEILASFPDSDFILGAGTEDACPDVEALRNDDTFRHDCARFTENIAEGRFDPQWLSEAWSAHERRKIGDFDEHLEWKFQSTWGIELPEDFKIRRQKPAAAAAPAELDYGEPSQPAGDRKDPENGQEPNDDADEEGQRPQETKLQPETVLPEAPGATSNGGAKRKVTPLNDTDSMEVDELQAEAGADNQQTVPEDLPVLKKLKSTGMDVDGTDVVDELG